MTFIESVPNVFSAYEYAKALCTYIHILNKVLSNVTPKIDTLEFIMHYEVDLMCSIA